MRDCLCMCVFVRMLCSNSDDKKTHKWIDLKALLEVGVDLIIPVLTNTTLTSDWGIAQPCDVRLFENYIKDNTKTFSQITTLIWIMWTVKENVFWIVLLQIGSAALTN